jgi:hypothetical protein
MTREFVNLMQEISEYDVAVNNKKVLDFIQNESNSLDERWEVYVDACNSGFLNNPSAFLPKFLNSLPSPRDLGIERHEIVDHSLVTNFYGTYGVLGTREDNDPDVIALKNVMMLEGKSSWTVDW